MPHGDSLVLTLVAAFVLAFVLGGVFYVAVDWAIQRLNDHYGGGEAGGASPW